MKKIFIILLITAPMLFYAQTTEQIIRNGNEQYRRGALDSAEKEYAKVSTYPRAVYNKGNALYKQDKKTEAKQVFETITTPDTDLSLRTRSYYNKGVVLSSEKKLEESIEAYKNVLRLDPNDKEARENLQKALLELKKKDPPKKKEPKKNPPKKQPPQPKLNQKQTEQKLKQLEQKEKQTQQKIQQKRPVGVAPKDW